MTALMRTVETVDWENPRWVTRYVSARECLGPNQRITSRPAAIAAASSQRQASRRKQAAYMTAPERFAKKVRFALAPRPPSIHDPQRSSLWLSICAAI